MPRISSDQTQERHAFLLDLFRQQPDISRQEALARFKDQFDATISPKLFNQLREQALGEADGASSESTPSHETSNGSVGLQLEAAASAPPLNGAAQPAKKAKSKAGPKNVFVDASSEQLAFLERVLQQLQEAGASNLRIDHATDRWMVIAVDAK